MKNLKTAGKVIGGILVGTLLGATIGLLFAPQSGSKTRNKIASGAKDLKDKMKKEANALRKKAEELEGLAEEKIKNMANKMKQEKL